jgi:hypothetical protein
MVVELNYYLVYVDFCSSGITGHCLGGCRHLHSHLMTVVSLFLSCLAVLPAFYMLSHIYRALFYSMYPYLVPLRSLCCQRGNLWRIAQVAFLFVISSSQASGAHDEVISLQA